MPPDDDPLTDDHELCQWDGPLLPLEDIDYIDRINHGTTTGYNQHRRWKIPYCQMCRDAHTVDNRMKRLRRSPD